MYRFDKLHVKELQEFLFFTPIHDARIKEVKYERDINRLLIRALNTTYDSEIAFIFLDVNIVLAIKGNDPGSRETIISLTIEEDFSCFENCFFYSDGMQNNSLYCVFQMFSGDEIHIVSREINIELLM